VLLSAGTGISLELEEAVELLSEAVLACNEDRHNGHGQDHGQDEAEKAYKDGIHQLMTRDFEKEYALKLLQKQREDLWYGVGSKGGPVPEAVIFPQQDDPKKLNVLVTAPDGTPSIYPADIEADEMFDVPTEENAVKDKEGVSWQRKRRWSFDTRARKNLPSV
jgi:hypothetical protein